MINKVFTLDKEAELKKANAELVRALGASNICLHDWAVKGGAKNTFDLLSSNSKLIDKYEVKDA